MVEFNIVENFDILDTIGDDFLRLYNDGVKVKDICKELDISKNQFQNILRRYVREGKITKVRNPNAGQKRTILNRNQHNPKNYFYSRQYKGFIVRRKSKYYGCFKEEKNAERFVELMRECDWDFERRKEIKKRVLEGE